jgi:hypothetical protein
VTERHLAVVPVSAYDDGTARALSYAATLAPEVLAVHVAQSGQTCEVEDAWTQSGCAQPLVIFNAVDSDCALAFDRAMQVMLRAEALEKITVVLPPHPTVGAERLDWRDGLTPTTSVVVQRMPA